MKSVLIIAIILCSVSHQALCGVEEDWLQFKADYNKTYKHKAEEKTRFKAFRSNLKEINKHNKRYRQGLVTYEKGITAFADLTQRQFDKKYKLDKLGQMKRYHSRHRKHPVDKNLTVVNLDWRDKGAVTSVKEQGLCGSCWIFSGIGVLEGYYFRKTGKLISLSEQNVVDCFSNTSCSGGFPGETLTYVKENGVSTEAEYPYKDKQMACKPSLNKIRINFKSYDFINGTENELKTALEKYGPIAVSMFVNGRLRLYTQGVWYDKKCSEVTNHAMLLVGYGTEKGQDYWLIKNSWGRNWGEDGYFKVARNKHVNYCGLTYESIYVT